MRRLRDIHPLREVREGDMTTIRYAVWHEGRRVEKIEEFHHLPDKTIMVDFVAITGWAERVLVTAPLSEIEVRVVGGTPL